MKHEYKYKRTGSAWNVLYAFAGILILFFALPVLALNSSLLDSIDNWSDDINNQLKIVITCCVLGLIIAVRYLVKKLKRAE
jgi:SNF family Na+-dependent transporter